MHNQIADDGREVTYTRDIVNDGRAKLLTFDVGMSDVALADLLLAVKREGGPLDLDRFDIRIMPNYRRDPDDPRDGRIEVIWELPASARPIGAATPAQLPASEDDDDSDRYAGEVQAILMGFESELCDECGRDLDRHIIAPDSLGHAHAWCMRGND